MSATKMTHAEWNKTVDVKSVRRCLEHGCGGIVLKSTPHINAPLAGRSPRPYMASLRPLGLKSSFLADPSLPVVPEIERGPAIIDIDMDSVVLQWKSLGI